MPDPSAPSAEQLINSAPVPMALATPDGRYLLANPAMHVLLRCAPDTLAGEHVAAHLVDAEAIVARALASVARGETVWLDAMGGWPDAGQRVIAIGLSPLPDGTVLVTARAAEGNAAPDEARYDLASAFESAQALAHIATWERDVESGVGRWSPEYWEILGRPPAAAPPPFEEYVAIIHPNDRERVRAAFEASRRGTGVDDITYRIVRLDGAVRTVHGFSRHEPAAGGRPARVVGLLQDITDLTEAADRERQAAALLVAVVDAVSDALVFRDASDTPIWFNRAYERLIGRSAAEIHGSTLGQFLHPDDVPRLQALRDRRAEMADAADAPLFRILRPDGTTRYFEASWGRVQMDGEHRGLVTTARDVTDRVAAESEAAARTAELAAIMEAAPLAIMVIDDAARIVSSNPATTRLFGWDADELFGQPVTVLWPSDAPAARLAAFAQFVTTSTGTSSISPRTLDVEGQRRDGSRFPAALIFTTLPVPDAPPRFLGIVTDLSERRLAEEQVRILQKNEALGMLVAGVAHDFNNLLTAIRGGIDIARQRPDEQRWFEMALSATDRASALVTQLLQFARRGPVVESDVALRPLLAEVLQLIRTISDRRLVFDLDAPDTLPPVRGDATQLQQVFMNLLINARDAVTDHPPNGESGSIAVRVRLEGESAAPVIAVSIADNGPGVPAESRDRIFDPFFTTKPVGKGTGLGLSTVIGIVRQHGGTIELDPATGHGATFHVRLPGVVPPLDEQAAGAGSVQEPALAGRRVLIVDDEPVLGQVAATFLSAVGMQPLITETAAAALELLAREAVDVVVLDLNMPGLSGWDALAIIRARYAATRVLVLSGDIDEQAVQQYRPDATLRKPYRSDDLVDAVRRALQGADGPAVD